MDVKIFVFAELSFFLETFDYKISTSVLYSFNDNHMKIIAINWKFETNPKNITDISEF